MRSIVLTPFLVAVLLTPAAASPATLQVDPDLSFVSVELCVNAVLSVCDSDVSPVSGLAIASVDCLTDPAEIQLHDFDLQLDEPINLFLSFSIFGSLTATATNVGLSYQTPGIPLPPTALVNGDFSYPSVPSDLSGQLSYNATSLVCNALQQSGLACNAVIDLSTLALNPLTIDGSAVVNGRDITVILDINVSGPIDPNNPGLGTLTTSGLIVASGTVPLLDIDVFSSALVGHEEDLDILCEADMNGDGQLNGHDVQPYADALLAP